MHRIEKRKKQCILWFITVEQVHNKHCITDKSQDTAAFVTRVVSTPTTHEFLQMLGKRRCSAHGLVATRSL